MEKKSPNIDRLRKKPVTDPLREDVTAIPCRKLLSSISFRISCHSRKRTRKIEKGKDDQIRKRKQTYQIFDTRLSSRPQVVFPFRSSLFEKLWTREQDLALILALSEAFKEQ